MRDTRILTTDARPWRALALGLCALALALNGYAAWRHTPPRVRPKIANVSATPTSQPASPAVPLQESLRQVELLKDGGDPAALESLIAIARQSQPAVVSAAVDGIARIGGDRARQFLSESFAKASDAELGDLANALATMGDPKARDALRAGAQSQRIATRVAAFSALSTLDTPDVRDFMLSALSSPDPFAAVGYFVDCREPRALPALEKLARSPNPELSRCATDAIFAQGANAEAAVLRLLRDEPELSDALLQTPPRTLSVLRAVRSASVARLRGGAIADGPLFYFMEQDPSKETRDALLTAARDPASAESALRSLARRGDSASLAALSELASGTDPRLAARAACALIENPDSRSRVPLQRAGRGPLQARTDKALAHINAGSARPI